MLTSMPYLRHDGKRYNIILTKKWFDAAQCIVACKESRKMGIMIAYKLWKDTSESIAVPKKYIGKLKEWLPYYGCEFLQLRSNPSMVENVETLFLGVKKHT